ncbi:DNA repair protein RecO [Treponema sp.]|uniref:DNA repair protein RecO n=1 Tax=Treponema sp. TaxID=166 RepID=UPI003F00288D
MSERNRRMKSVILSLKKSGEDNRLVKAVSAENGIFTAMLYGGAKSRLKSLVQPFYTGILYIYADEARHSTKITDFDVQSCHLSFRTSLLKSWAASLACEIVLKTKCAGDPEKAFLLLCAFLDGIDSVEGNEIHLGILRFLWRYLALLGLQPETRTCAVCGTQLLTHEQNAAYIENQNGFVCADCIAFSTEKGNSTPFASDLDSLTYLTAINELSPGQVRSLLIPAESVYNMKRLLYNLIEKSCGIQLETLKSGIGIL